MKPISDRLRRVSFENSGLPGQPSAAANELFVYGSLTIEDVVQVLLGRVPSSRPATAPGWCVVRLPERVYPGLVRGDGEAEGKVFTDLTEDEWTILDAFEDPAYDLVPVVLDEAEGPTVSYVWTEDHLPERWSAEAFREAELQHYLDRCRGWLGRYRDV